MQLAEAKIEQTEEELVSAFKTSARRSHEIAKLTPIFACYNKAPDYFIQPPSKSSTHFIIDAALTDLGISDRTSASAEAFTNAELAQREQQGELYVMFPLEKSRVWVSPTDDYYKSFEYANKQLRITSVSNKNLQEAFAFLGEFDTWPQLKKLLNDPEVQRFKGDDNAARFASFKRYHHGITWFRALFDLDANGFSSLLVSQRIPIKREVWISGDVLAVNAEKYDDLHKRKIIK